MYKLLIVEDEAIVREGIKESFDWPSMGFELIGDCEDGSEAMGIIEGNQPDIILTDICMPIMDGLELTQRVTRCFPQTKVIILTGYGEFEYAQQAVKLKAYDFILKPITAKELSAVLKKVRDALDEEKGKIEDINRLKLQLKESMPVLKERFLNRLINGKISDEIIIEKSRYFEIKLEGKFFLTLVTDIDEENAIMDGHLGMTAELFYFAVSNICEEIIAEENHGIVFQDIEGKTVMLLCGESSECLIERASKLAENIREAVGKYLRTTISVGIGKKCGSKKDIYQSYQGALAALEYRFLIGKNHVINILDVEGNKNENTFHIKELEEKLKSRIKIGTLEEIELAVSEIFRILLESCISLQQCYIYINQIVYSVASVLRELELEEAEFYGSGLNPFTEIFKFKSLNEVEQWLKNLCLRISKFIINKRNSQWKLHAIKAEEYIKANYMAKSMSLNTICKHLHVSTTYFSMIFKNYKGETFVEYLTRVRLEKAMELLKSTDMKMYEIADEIGYNDPYYFSITFKKTTGMTTKEFRESMKR